MIIIELLILVVVCAVLGSPLLTVLGYLPVETEPQRHLWIGRLAPFPFLLLAAANALAHSYIQAGAALVISLIFFLMRDHFTSEQRIRGDYARWFVFLSAIYWASGLSTSAYAAAVLFLILGFCLPYFFRLITESSGYDEASVAPAPAVSDAGDYALEPAPKPLTRSRSASVSEPAPTFTTPPQMEASPAQPNVGSRPAFQPVPGVAPVTTPEPGSEPAPAPAPAATPDAPAASATPAQPRRRVIKPIDIVAIIASSTTAENIAQLGISADRQSDWLTPGTRGEQTQPSAPTKPAEANVDPAPAVRSELPATPTPIAQAEPPAPVEPAPRPVSTPAAETVEEPDDEPAAAPAEPVTAPPVNDLSGFQLPKLPPRTAMPKPFESSEVDPDKLETEQPKTKTTGASFRLK